MMKIANRPSFHFIGISVRTTNENNQAMTDIPALWGKFMSEGIKDKIPNKSNDNILCMYTDYEGDHNMPYTTVLGCQVDDLSAVPEGMRGITVKGAGFASFIAKGDINQGSVAGCWARIWDSNLDRAYSADFEVYDERAANPADAEVEIFVGTL